MIHIMYEKMSSLVFNLMKRFIIWSSLTVCVDGKTKAKQGANLASISLSDDQMNLDSIDIGTGDKVYFIFIKHKSCLQKIILQKVFEFLHNHC